MFKRSNSSTVNQSNSSVDVKSSVNNNKPNNGLLSMKLGDNNLVFKDGDWVLDSSDLDLATFEIEKLIDEKEILVKSLSDALDQVEELKKEVVEVNDTKSVILGMVTNLLLA